MSRNRKNEIILFCVAAVVCAAVIIICISVSMGQHSSENSSSRGGTAQVSEEAPGGFSDEPYSEPEPVVTEPENTQPAPEPSEESSAEETPGMAAGNVISMARSLIGTDFADGGETPASGFDNSGFIYYVLRENGYITCPRGVSRQSEMGTAVGFGELRTGDLVFFSESGTVAEFGGIYIGGGKMIACLMPGTKVKEVDITTNYYQKNFFRGVAIS